MNKTVGMTYSDESKIAPYIAALEAAGLAVLPIPPGAQIDPRALGGVVLTGGVDINPRLYRQEAHQETEEPNDARDATELDVLHQALQRELPLLAICRGMQLMNVARGGSLHQHISACAIHRRYDLPKPTPVHTVDVVPGTKLAGILGSGPVQVNSRHHQAVDRVGDGLSVSARSPDGVVEGIELPGLRFAVGVQWHPEDQAAVDPVQARLFTEFARSVK